MECEKEKYGKMPLPPSEPICGELAQTTPELLTRAKSVYLFYDHYTMSKWTHSLYKVKIKEGLSDSEGGSLTPILEFPNEIESTRGMRCAYLDSKIYILGGVVSSRKDEGAFPRDVLVFDIKSSSLTNLSDVDSGARLNSGKPCPCVFAAESKVYALTTINCVPIPSPVLLDSLNLFECFDPTTNKWEVLPDPPINIDTLWLDTTVLGRRRQVVLLTWEPSRDQLVCLVYDLCLQTWTRKVAHSEVSATFQEGKDGRHLYGLRPCRPPIKSNLCLPMTSDQDMSLSYGSLLFDGVVEMSTDKPKMEWFPIFCRQPYPECSTRLLRYAGDDCFYYIVAGAAPHPSGPDSWGYLPADGNTRAVTVTAFKDVEEDEDDVGSDIGGISKDHHTSKATLSFKAQILHSQEFLMKTSVYAMARLVGCYVVDSEQL